MPIPLLETLKKILRKRMITGIRAPKRLLESSHFLLISVLCGSELA